MRTKRSLLVTFDFPPLVTGIGTYLSNIWRYLEEDNYILAPAVGNCQEIDTLYKSKITRYPSFSQSRLPRTFILFFYVGYLAIKKRIDIIFCCVPLSIGFIGLVFKKLFRLPYGVFYYGGEFTKFKDNLLLWPVLKTIMQNAEFIITISEFSRQEARSFQIKEERILKITPGVDINRFRPNIECVHLKEKLQLSGKKVLLTVSRLVKRKGVHLVINALSRIKKDFPDLVYLITGRGEEEDNLRRQVRENGLEKDVIFLGYVPEEDLPIYYSLCDIYIMPNVEVKEEDNVEGFGISFIEASACAKPVIGGITGGVKDAVVDGQTGLLIDPENSDKLTEAVLRLLRDKNYAALLGRNGCKRTQEEFSWDLRAQQIKNILREA